MKTVNYRNIFLNPDVASEYDSYYQNEPGKTIDKKEKEIISGHLRNLPKENWLELGCGTGHWTKFFSDWGFQITAVDNSEAMLEIARSKNMKNVQLLNADAARLPFPDVCFSGIVSITMLEFVDDLNQVLNEIDRVLKPLGTLVLGCLNAGSELGKNKNNDPVFKHAHFFTPEEIEKMLFRFGNPRISAGVYFTPDFELLDGTKQQSTAEPAFIAASVKKTK
jgi:ubiquinone/menaquinone biosynthesis C-methylase UbiE